MAHVERALFIERQIGQFVQIVDPQNAPEEGQVAPVPRCHAPAPRPAVVMFDQVHRLIEDHNVLQRFDL